MKHAQVGRTVYLWLIYFCPGARHGLAAVQAHKRNSKEAHNNTNWAGCG